MESKPQKATPIFNDQYDILSSLGEGNTSKVYLARHRETGQTTALKIFKEEFLHRSEESISQVQSEITILSNLKHPHIVGLQAYGDKGCVKKPSGRLIENLVYLQMEHVTGGLFFDLCQLMGPMGEDTGRFFGLQMLDALEHMHGKRVAHRDLKLENILLDPYLNMKIADFGFATYKSIDQLKSYRGTLTYMAPEVKEGKTYNGAQIDMFSFAVILFIIVHGIFPFKEARKEEYFYNLLMTGQHELYFEKVNGTNLSPEFKDLIVRLFSYDASKRPTSSDLRDHAWFSKPGFNYEHARK